MGKSGYHHGVYGARPDMSRQGRILKLFLNEAPQGYCDDARAAPVSPLLITRM